MKYYVVKYVGQFGFIKPWTAVRDSETFSQQFLTPSIVEGIEKKLFPELLSNSGNITKILRHRLNYAGIAIQKERTWSKGGIQVYRDKGQFKTNMSTLDRGVMLYPNLYLAFASQSDALIGLEQHICLCRNEDIMFPEQSFEMLDTEFDTIDGFELLFDENANSGFKVGHNRFANAKEMYGWLKIFGDPIRAI